MRERKYDAIMAKATAMARGVRRYLAAPVRWTTGMKTMQMARLETKAGAATCCALSRMARCALDQGFGRDLHLAVMAA